VTEVACDDWRLIADALAGQSRRVAARARSRAYTGPALAGARANVREESDRLAMRSEPPLPTMTTVWASNGWRTRVSVPHQGAAEND
jgi:hypothetical protein